MPRRPISANTASRPRWTSSGTTASSPSASRCRPICSELNWLETVGDVDCSHRVATLQINDILSIKRAVQRGVGIAMLPDYVFEKDSGLVQILPETEVPSFDTYFCYPDAMKNQAKLNVFRDFVISNRAAGRSRGWPCPVFLHIP